MNERRPDHDYIARVPGCGCVVAAIADMPDHKKDVAKEIAERRDT